MLNIKNRKTKNRLIAFLTADIYLLLNILVFFFKATETEFRILMHGIFITGIIYLLHSIKQSFDFRKGFSVSKPEIFIGYDLWGKIFFAFCGLFILTVSFFVFYIPDMEIKILSWIGMSKSNNILFDAIIEMFVVIIPFIFSLRLLRLVILNIKLALTKESLIIAGKEIPWEEVEGINPPSEGDMIILKGETELIAWLMFFLFIVEAIIFPVRAYKNLETISIFTPILFLVGVMGVYIILNFPLEKKELVKNRRKIEVYLDNLKNNS